MSQTLENSEAATENAARIVYILYPAGLLLVGVTGIVGVIIAYVYRGDAPAWLDSHFRFQIRTFWIGAIFLFFGITLALIWIGLLIIAFWVVWLLVRCIKGLKALLARQPHPDPAGWLF